MNDYDFGNFLYTLRKEKGLSQSQFGEMLGVTNKSVSKWETGSSKPGTKLIPRIAEILGITVEELFACRKFENNSDTEKINAYLLNQKKKYAILSSVFLSALIILPLLLIEFICIIMGFRIADDVAGPIGSIGFILAYVISLVSFIIYRNSFKHSYAPKNMTPATGFVKAVKNIILICTIAWWYLSCSLLIVFMLILLYSDNDLPAYIFLSVAVFILILLLGVIICSANIKRLLKIKSYVQTKNKNNRTNFAGLPVWVKICVIVLAVLFPLVIAVQIFGYLTGGAVLIRAILIVILFSCEIAVIIYNCIQRNK